MLNVHRPYRLFALLMLLSAMFVAAMGHNAQAREPVFTWPDSRTKEANEQPWPVNSFLVLAYHDVKDDVADQRFLAVTTKKLVAEFAWLRENGYHPVSVQQIVDAHQGLITLPEKAVLLTFDDGYRSFYTRVFPLLKAYQWPAMLAPVGHWVSTPDSQEIVDFGGLPVSRSAFTNWDEISEMAQSGLVEIASHTQQLHYGQLANPQGNTQPAAASRRYYPETNSYESLADFDKRINADITAITNNLKKATGQAPRAWVWPYGAMHGRTWQLAKQQGYQLSFSLDIGLANARNLDNIPRYLVSNDQSLEEFAASMASVRLQPTQRVAHVDLDYIYDPDPEQQERNLGALIQRLQDMRVTTVFLQAFADPLGDGLVREVYFPNRVLPMRADLFNRAAWQLRTRGGVQVFAWMPTLALDLDPSYPRVKRAAPAAAGTPEQSKSPHYHVAEQEYRRLSFFDPRVRQAINTLYEDLAWQASFSGIVFHDDAMLREDEDMSAAAIAAYEAAGFKGPFPMTDASPEERQRWMRFKTQALTDFTLELLNTVRATRGEVMQSARNLYVNTVTQPESEAWFAQNFQDSLAAYDWVVPMVMPYMEEVPKSQVPAWLDQVVDAVKTTPGALNKTIFEVQAVDWRDGQPRNIATEEIASWLRRLNIRGARHMGYYPDDFASNHPDMKQMRKHLSNYWFPSP
ncbi:poly-beta-1,6-N-acetyl-D-glucosamine N-deacetylase PgaB [Lampropedia aestuarii]|uniref:poly-beta-1,6-N-acetyl-D-glucosamine N-deacetylase PgaB n=1 Tax=Lampropedia aestuarii TaxID=2562762 RepID=UPI002468BC69|nr:poly-beta-1,6-N-acetyl-D-glucosamine N-deacetylase PgaB [Lampropedia aestuarii]MDH5857630.1 poly-beta-1,6-N-acetyl-D-glucosamine N-deacetylase PgaB [Lampropedia aestuarii]